MSKGSYRKIIVGGKVYDYVVGTWCLKIRGLPVVSLTKVTGIPMYEIERGRRKRWFSVTPRDVADYIKTAVA